MPADDSIHSTTVEMYLEAWREQDPQIVGRIFTADAVYHERAFEDPMLGIDSITAYWQKKVVELQSSISVELLSLHILGDTVIAEWEAEFDDLSDGYRKRMREVAIMEFRGRQIASLREYWASQKLQRCPVATA